MLRLELILDEAEEAALRRLARRSGADPGTEAHQLLRRQLFAQPLAPTDLRHFPSDERIEIRLGRLFRE